ncbi:MAG: UDP-N-acetylglucosamine--N-acetylmuramyl-(pentapeptide) pyrophosphoryl-undecaprenol N-acetylglucosamine transferase [Chloroflexota bacterium]|nr:UDP-N-acetylglucosamine--N-acetylmuramyl-(pentapeptide) pyrophosphoryl-undecaprenol N-acetylglucosamine transferase [Chloroflexota bacterium]
MGRPLAAPDRAPAEAPAHAVLWTGSAQGMEQALVQRAGIDYRGISTGQLRGKNPLTTVANAGKMIAGFGQSRTILDEFRPDVCLATGGYVCVPVVLACRQRGVPVLIYLPDLVPGSAIRWLSRLAQRVAVSFADAAPYFGGLAPQGKAVVTGYPVRAELVAAAQDRRAARRRLAEMLRRPLAGPNDSDPPLLLVWGGSQGARSINLATWAALPQILPHAQVVHVVGQRDWPMTEAHVQEQMAAPEWQPSWADRYHPVDYLHEAMPWALAAADLTVARAGASIFGEFAVAGLPSILAPLPFAGVNQLQNAQILERSGAAVIVADAQLAAQLGPTVAALLTDRDRLLHMERAVRSLAQPEAARRIAHELERLAANQTH